METGSPSAIEIFLIVMSAPVVLILAAYGLILWLRKRSRDAIHAIGDRLIAFTARFDQIAAFLQEFVGIDQEPYATHLDNLQKEATDLRDQMQRFITECRAFEDDIRATGIKRLQDIINAPVYWFRRWRRSGVLRQESEAIDQRLTDAENRIGQINDLPWDLATQCRQMDKDVNEIVRTARDLQSKGARGVALQTIINQIPQFGRSLDEIPNEFLEADQQGLLQAANLDSTVRVFEVLNRLRPAVGRYLPQVREWNTAYEKATTEFTVLKQAGASLRQAMLKPPEGLVMTSLQERLDQTAQLAAELGQRLSQPEVEGLKTLARDITRLRKVIQDTEQQFTRAGQQANELGRVLGELHEGLEKLAGQFSDLEKRSDFPLAWDQSSSTLNDLRKRLQSLGTVQQPRTPDQVVQHLKEAEGIRTGHKTHLEAFPKVAEKHGDLVALLQSPELKEGSVWLRKAHETINQAAVYDPRNWPKQASVQTLPAELDDLNRLHDSLIPADASTPVKESEIDQRLKDTQQIISQHKTMRTRVDSVRAQLEKIQAQEKEGKDKLAESDTALERVSLLTESNDLLDQLATAEIDRLSEEIRQLGNELNARGQGEVEKKLAKIQAQADKVNRALNNWLSGLNTAAVAQGKQINDLLIQLDAVALLNEPAVLDARNVLSRDEYASALQGGQGSVSPVGGLRGVAARVNRTALLGDLEVTADIKRKNDLYQTLLAVQQALEERTVTLLTAYQETIQARNAARERLAEVTKRVPDKRTWPPCNQSALTEAQVLRPIDDKWDGLKKQARGVEPAILELGRLTQQYRLATERTHQLMLRVEQDEERTQELEEQIAQLKLRWQAQLQAFPNSPIVREGVQQLMSQTDSQLAYVKHQYMRGALSYEEAIHNLQLLCDELLAARVSVDDQNDIGLNENHHVKQP